MPSSRKKPAGLSTTQSETLCFARDDRYGDMAFVVGTVARGIEMILVGAAGIEPATAGLEIRCSIRLSYAPEKHELQMR